MRTSVASAAVAAAACSPAPTAVRRTAWSRSPTGRDPQEPPPTSDLSYEQYAGRACCWCGKQLQHGAVSAGIARGRMGAHVLDVEVYACPDCAGDHVQE
ncbi:hypothetical protein [Streptomyces sp. NPDC001978]|uniref:hypothetical protein n=1 Tax=Streptomyces sp. NPDC001978 TaxID=3364627 RepID=UPI0036BA8977